MPDTLQPMYAAGGAPSKTRLILQFLLPTPAEFLVYTIISAALLCVLNLWVIIGIISGDPTENGFHIASILSSYSDRINSIFSGGFWASASLIILWGLLGCVAYMGAWVVKSYFSRVYEDVAAQQNIQPTSEKAEYWKSVASHNIFFACTIFVAAAYLVACFSFLIPKCLSLFTNGLESWFEWQTAVALVVSTLGLVVLFQIARILFRLIHNSWKIYFATE
jgi:hypothetical protein